jgi:hypothetical protein
MSYSIASRVKASPRICTVRNEEQLIERMKKMSSLDIWNAMFTRGVKGWKHKFLSDEFERRRQLTLGQLGFKNYRR